MRRAEIAGQECLSKLLFVAWSYGPSCGLEGDVESVFFVNFFFQGNMLLGAALFGNSLGPELKDVWDWNCCGSSTLQIPRGK